MRWDLAGFIVFPLLVAFGIALAAASDLLTQSERVGLVMLLTAPFVLHLLTYAIRNVPKGRPPEVERSD